MVQSTSDAGPISQLPPDRNALPHRLNPFLDLPQQSHGRKTPIRFRDTPLVTEPASVQGRVRVVTRDGREAGEFEILDSAGQADLPWQAKYFFYVYLPKGTEISALEVKPVEALSAAAEGGADPE